MVSAEDCRLAMMISRSKRWIPYTRRRRETQNTSGSPRTNRIEEHSPILQWAQKYLITKIHMELAIIAQIA